MEYHFTSPQLLYSTITVLSILFLHFLKGNKRSLIKLPPSPPAWPVFGHLFNLGTLPYATMANMKDKYGTVIWLKICSVNTMAILTADAASDLYKNHDLGFSDRLIVEAVTSHDFHKSSMAFSPFGPHWGMLRRFCYSVTNTKIIDDMCKMRKKCVGHMLSWIGKEAETASGIEIIEFVSLANVNLIGNLLFSRDLAEPKSKTASELFTSVTGFLQWSGEPNVSYLFKWLKPFDLQGLKRKMDRDLAKAMEIVSAFVKERLQEKQTGGENLRKDLLDVLLEFEGNGADEQGKLPEYTILVFLVELFLGGVDTSTHTTEWALAELLRNPDKLPYLHAVIKETLRLHPPAPLIPRKASKDINFMGYDISKGTHLMVNVWAIMKDPQYWSGPLSFKPERFLGSNIDFKGKDYEYLPFGPGRRICPGLPLGRRMLHLLIGSLLHEFDWELEDSSPLDMSEKMGLTIKMLKPLRAIPKKPLC